VIQAFSREAPAMTLSEVARRTDISRATARRILLTLESLEEMHARFLPAMLATADTIATAGYRRLDTGRLRSIMCVTGSNPS
jgi:IclR helix-turn-helix domain